MRRRSLPVDFEGFVQRSQMRLEVRLNAAIRIGPAHDGENGKQQYVRQPIEFALGATRVRDCGEQRQKRLQGLQGLQGDLPSIRSPHTDSDFFASRNRPLRLSHQELENCCIWDSVESVEQPWAIPQPTRGCAAQQAHAVRKKSMPPLSRAFNCPVLLRVGTTL